MGRTRKITSDDILDAAERVVTRLGAAGLSIDTVAQEAGVSKSSVLYDHKSKSALLEAMIDRRIRMDQQWIQAAVAENGHTPHPELFGRLQVAQAGLGETEKAIALAIGAAMSSEDGVKQQMREWTASDLAAMQQGARPQAALMAYLALTGFYCTELFNLHAWDDIERAGIIDGIRQIYQSYPGQE